MLAARVAAGELPPVEQRLPDDPVVVEPVDTIGTYGGTWRRLAKSYGDMGLNARLGYETLLRWDSTGTKIIPGIAESWEMNEDATEFTFHLRKGMKWSDGHPFTSEDFQFTHDFVEPYGDMVDNNMEWKKLDRKLMELDTPDAHTVVIRFPKSYGMLPEILCYRALTRSLFLPKHYLKQFHKSFRDPDELDAEAKAARFVNWRALFLTRSNLEKNPDLPSINAFICKEPLPQARALAVRNPYYWKVDPQGNQLPYIDRIAYTTVFDGNVLNMKAQDGEVDFQTRHINASNYTLFMESRTKAADPKNHYRVHVEPSTGAIVIYLNQYSRDEAMRPILQDKRFRVALSVAINRDEINEMVYSGLGEPNNGVMTDMDLYYIKDMDKTNIQYDPALANRLLDEVGLKRDANGMRRMPNGKPFHQVLHIFPSEAGDSQDMWILVSEYFREVGLQFSVKHGDATLSRQRVGTGDSDFWAYISQGLHWELDGSGHAPLRTSSYTAPLYGQYFFTNGKLGVKPPPEHQELVDWYQDMKSTPSSEHRLAIGHRFMQRWAEKCYIIGLLRKPEVFIISKRFGNVPARIIQDYTVMTPGYMGIEQFFIKGGGN